MAKLTIQTLGYQLAEKRGSRGVRETAKEIGITHSTLIRIEKGHLPDLETFGKVCRWLKVDPGMFLGTDSAPQKMSGVITHFRKDKALKPETAMALADLILTAQRALMAMENNAPKA